MSWKDKPKISFNMKPGLLKRKINSVLRASLHEAVQRGLSEKMTAPNGSLSSPEAQKLTEESKKAVTSFVGMYILVAATVALAWLLGYFDFSFLWVFISIAVLFVVWRAKISKIISQHLSNEEAVLYRKRAFRQNETAEWFNFLLNRWWVFSATNIEELVKKNIDERLWDIRPSFVDGLEVSSFTVGEQTPNIKNVRTFECSESTPGSLQPISWFNVHRPPAGLQQLSSYQVVVEADLSLVSEDFKMIFRGRVGSGKVSLGFDMVVEDLHIQGTLQAILCLSMDIPFPHISKATVCFKEKPDVTFNICLLRNLSLMEIPLLKSWIHNNVMEGLTEAMVDPASVDINFNKVGPTLMGQTFSKKEKAQGVLTVQVKGYPPRNAVSEDIRYVVLNIGTRKRQTHEVPATEEWEDVCSFFIYNLATEKIKIKSKCMRLITSTTLEQKEVNLSSFPFQVNSVCETTVDNKDGSKMVLTMHYTALPPIKTTEVEESQSSKSNTLAGVMYICCHGATNVLAADKTGASDPYCVVFCDRKRVLTTPFIPRTRNPHWESWVEFFVRDYTMSSFSFFVYDWDGTNTINDDFLGSVHFRMSESQPEVIKRTLTLGYNKPDEGFSEDKKCGQITFTAVFRPVESVSKSEKFHQLMKSYKPNDYLYKEDLMSPSTMAGLPGRRSTAASTYMNDLLSNKVIVELTILQGKDMVAMDRNGFSDPFCIVSVKDKKVFTTSVKKKTLFPKWNETVTLEMSLVDAHNLTIDVFDKDVISKDFMGTLRLSLDELKELSLKGTSEWYSLDKIKNGKLQLKCQVIAKDTLSKMKDSTPSPEEVFDPPLMPSHQAAPGLDITNSSISSIEHQSLFLQSPPKGHQTKVKRAPSDAASHDHDHPINGSVESSTLPRMRMTKADSSNSINMLQRLGDRASLIRLRFRRHSSASVSDKLFSVTGKILRVRGNFPNTATEIYCKVRLEVPGNRLSLFHNTRLIGKSHVVPLNDHSPSLDLEFEVDKGSGIPMEACLIFTLKHSRKEHVTTKSVSLRSLLADTEGVPKWVPVGNNVEIELVLHQGQPMPGRKRSNSLLKSLSFRKEKP
ncbi:uncharacterized protein LOC106052623 isoform X3 [Biomphalaria glabrata]|uniref:Uncharacterized protein LOC106052623 isoform X3 n=1 Tax=Biomphalaria glabrata TaxID=6526 RepID=A0A9W2ZUQ3_BIOGL|nr:uncharacterized protein LOC106052623 isoform X3 [Biomphalaria glabrata]